MENFDRGPCECSLFLSILWNSHITQVLQRRNYREKRDEKNTDKGHAIKLKKYFI